MSLTMPDGWTPDPLEGEIDTALIEVFRAFQSADPDGLRMARLMRATLDQLYDGQRTGRYSWAQLHKTERTHFGTLFEINVRREFEDIIDEGEKLDYRIAGHDVDCKFSQKLYGWMIPPEAFGHLLVVGFVNDAASEFAFGVVRASERNLRTAANRDAKVQLNPQGRDAVRWIQRPGSLPANILLHADPDDVDAIMADKKSGQRRVNELFRRLPRQRISRNVIATVAQQADYMKRVRYDGGSRSDLRPAGYIILGDRAPHRSIAEQLGLPVPRKGEMVSARLAPAGEDDIYTVLLDDRLWRVAHDDEVITVPAPIIPHA